MTYIKFQKSLSFIHIEYTTVQAGRLGIANGGDALMPSGPSADFQETPMPSVSFLFVCPPHLTAFIYLHIGPAPCKQTKKSTIFSWSAAAENGKYLIPEEYRADVSYGNEIRAVISMLYSDGIMANDRTAKKEEKALLNRLEKYKEKHLLFQGKPVIA